MARMKSLLCSAALALCVMIVNFQRAEAEDPVCGGFVLTCINFNVDDSGIFTADCQTPFSGGAYTSQSQLNIDLHIGNTNGVLIEGAGFAESCQEVGVHAVPAADAVDIFALCQDNLGVLQSTSYNVNNHIVDSNGVLGWSC